MRWICLGMLLCLGCGGSSGQGETTGSSGIGGGSSQSACERLCEKETACGVNQSPTCVQECAAQFACIRDDYMSAFAGCYVDENPQCQKTLEDCSGAAAMGIMIRPIDMDYLIACLARRTECGNVWGDDFCSSGVREEACVNQAQTCLDKPCAEVQDCIQTAFALK